MKNVGAHPRHHRVPHIAQRVTVLNAGTERTYRMRVNVEQEVRESKAKTDFLERRPLRCALGSSHLCFPLQLRYHGDPYWPVLGFFALRRLGPALRESSGIVARLQLFCN